MKEFRILITERGIIRDAFRKIITDDQALCILDQYQTFAVTVEAACVEDAKRRAAMEYAPVLRISRFTVEAIE